MVPLSGFRLVTAATNGKQKRSAHVISNHFNYEAIKSVADSLLDIVGHVGFGDGSFPRPLYRGRQEALQQRAVERSFSGDTAQLLVSIVHRRLQHFPPMVYVTCFSVMRMNHRRFNAFTKLSLSGTQPASCSTSLAGYHVRQSACRRRLANAVRILSLVITLT